MNVNSNLILYFNEEEHKYSDEFGNAFTSTTTFIKEFEIGFDTKTMARNCERAGRKGDPRYRGKTAAMLEAEWKVTSRVACDNGNEKHNFLESSVKRVTGYNLNASKTYINGRIITVPDILVNPRFGRIDISFFAKEEIATRYPAIYEVLLILHNKGFSFYAEIGIFNAELLISGLIDLLAIKGNEFYIIDWKTNAAPIRYEAGYFQKDNNGNLTDIFVFTNKTFKAPINRLACSTGNKYAMQLSTYAYMTEQFGLKCLGLLLCHIRKSVTEDKERVDVMIIPYLKQEVIDIFEYRNTHTKPKRQTKILDFILDQ